MEILVQGQLDAYNSRDTTLFCSFFHSEVKAAQLISGKSLLSGMDEFEKIYRELFESNPKLHCELKSRIILESAVIDEEFVTGIARFPQGLHAVAIYGFRDDKIDRIWFPR